MKKENNISAYKTGTSIVILTYNRPESLKKLLLHLDRIDHQSREVIVVDNNSKQPPVFVKDEFPDITLIELEKNVGVSGRNAGIRKASGDIIITLDDDIVGITPQDIEYLHTVFEDHSIGAVCFKVLDEKDNSVINWCHHRVKEDFHNKSFITDEITEGAVAFRKKAVIDAGLYPDSFFISHEGPDLALRIMNLGYKVIYDPNITVTHSHSRHGRPSWRRYYYDTRNLFWLVARNYPVITGARRLFIGLAAMGIYSLRDGYTRYWLKGIYDGIAGFGKALDHRQQMSNNTLQLLTEMKKYRPGFWYMVKNRLFRKKVRI